MELQKSWPKTNDFGQSHYRKKTANNAWNPDPEKRDDEAAADTPDSAPSGVHDDGDPLAFSSATDPAESGAAVLSPSPAAQGEARVAIPEPHQEPRSGHAARDALAEHQRLQSESQSELATIEERLQTATVNDAMTLTRRRHELTNTLEHVTRIMPILEMRAAQEHKDEVTHEVNQLWRPLAERRVVLLAELEQAADRILDVFNDLDGLSNEQTAVLDKARPVDRSVEMLQGDLGNASKAAYAWLARYLGIVQRYPTTSSHLPAVDDVRATQEKFLNPKAL